MIAAIGTVRTQWTCPKKAKSNSFGYEKRRDCYSCKEQSKENLYLPSSDLPDTRDDFNLLLLTIQWLATETKGHEEVLNRISWVFIKLIVHTEVHIYKI